MKEGTRDSAVARSVHGQEEDGNVDGLFSQIPAAKVQMCCLDPGGPCVKDIPST